MNEYRNYRQKSGMRGFTKVMLGLLVIALASFGSIGIYQLIENGGEVPVTAQEDGTAEDAGQTANNADGAQTNTDEEFASLSSADQSEAMTAEEVAAKVIPSVVCIQSTGNDLSGNASQGSGIILTEDGYIATNAHVVSGYTRFQVILSDDTTYEAELIGEDDTTDLALLKIDATGLTPATLGDSDELEVAETVMAIGNPGGLQFSSSVTMGIVSAKDRPITTSMGASLNTIQTDAAINPGNSGGALVDMSGAVVGICSAKYVVENYEGMGFAITINEALPILNELREYGYVKSRGVLGMEYTFVDEMTARFYNLPVGLFIQNNYNENATALQSGDVITQVDGNDITDTSVLEAALSGKMAGETVTVQYYRDGQYYETEITLIENQETTTEDSQSQDGYNWYYSRYLSGGLG